MEIPKNTLQHIVIIPDGNRRWAKKRGQPAQAGHLAGAENSTRILKTALELKIPYLTIWGTSLANITERSPREVSFLFKIFENYFAKLSREVKGKEIKVNVLGRWKQLFPEETQQSLQKIIKQTKGAKTYNLTFLMAYSGLDEITQAVKKIAHLKQKDKKIKINGPLIKKSLWTKDLPPVDLVIRTGGEPHWSAGLMMWDVAEAQLHFTNTLWPDFSPEEFKKIIKAKSKTERRFGG